MEATTSGTKSLVIDNNPPIVPTESQQQQDPRYKMKYVNFTLSKAYGPLLGRLKSEDVASVLTRLYDSYNNSFVDASSNDNIGGDTSMSETDDLLESEWEKHLANEGNIAKKTDLQIYLMDDVVKNKDFDILSWWKVSSSKYPVVSKIAKDVLSIPISTVASESAFSTGGRILDSYRSSLSPKTVEALICTQQWLRSPSKEYNFHDSLEEVQNIEQVDEEYGDSPLSID